MRRGSIGMDGMTRFEEFNLRIDEMNDKHGTLFMPKGAKHPFEYKNYRDLPEMQEFADGPERLSQAALAYLEDEIGARNNPDMVHVMETRARLIKSGGSRAEMLSARNSTFSKHDTVMLIATKDGLFGLDSRGVTAELPHQTEIVQDGKKVKVDTINHMRGQNPNIDYMFRDGDKVHQAMTKTMDSDALTQNRGEVGKAVEAERDSRDHGVTVSFGR
jgi:hypothetical protein